MASLIVGDLDIGALSDEELYQRLVATGETVGPIVATTRKVYQRILAKKLGGDSSFLSLNTSNLDTYNESDEEADVEPSAAYVERISSGAVRRRVLQTSNMEQSIGTEEEETVYSPIRRNDAFTPSPRRPLRETDSFSYTPSQSYSSSFSSSTLKSSEANVSTTEAGKKSSLVGLLMKIIIAVMICIGLYLTLFGESKNEFDRLEDLAKTASEAIAKEKRRELQN